MQLFAFLVIHALYAVFIIGFLRVLYLQFRLILHIWAFMYGSYGFAVWRVMRDRPAHQTAIGHWGAQPRMVGLRRDLFRAWRFVIAAFVVLIAVVAAVYLTVPKALEGGMFTR